MNNKYNSLKRNIALSMAAMTAGVTGVASAAVNSGDARLSNIEMNIAGQNIIKNFSSANTSYNIELKDADAFSMSAIPTASDARISIEMNGVKMTNHTIANLDGGENVIKFTVTNGTASKVYTVTVKTPEVFRERQFNWRNATVYFVLTDRFYNGDTSNDSSYHRKRLPGGQDMATFHGGDLKGLTQKLDYLESLGVDAIWISAPYEQMHGWTGGADDKFPHYAFHGYYALDWTFMDRNMGTLQDMRNFVTEAHKRGIRVVMDVVMNHTGYSSLDDMKDYGWGAVKGASNASAGWLPNSGPYSFWNPNSAVQNDTDPSKGKDWSKWWGGWVRAFGDQDAFREAAGYGKPGGDDLTMCLAGLPDVMTEKTESVAIPGFLKTKWAKEKGGAYDDYRLPGAEDWRQDNKGAPADYISSWLAEWVREFGIDGFRVDTAKHVGLNRWAQLKEKAKAALKEWRASNRADEYAKDWTDDFWTTGESFGWQHGDTRYFTEGKFDSMINFGFNSTSGSSGRTPTPEDWKYLSGYLSGGNQVLSYVSSHDTGLHRPGDQKNVGTMFLLTPGGVQIYYGDETSRPYMTGDFGSDKDMKTRSDFNWDAVNNEDNIHWQKVGQFRRRNVSVGAGTHTAIEADTYGRKYDKDGIKNSVVFRLGTTAGQSYTISVGDHFADGAKVMDGYNMKNAAVVSGGKVTMVASGPVILLEPYGIVDGNTGGGGSVTPVPVKPVVTASPVSGTTFTDNINVALSASQGASIYYTLDGSTPSASSTEYMAPISITETTTVKTYAANEAGFVVNSFTYTKVEAGDDAGEDDGDTGEGGGDTGTGGGDTGEGDGTDTPVTSEKFIYFDDTTKSNVTVWAWVDDRTNSTVAGKWPGDPMTLKDGKYYWSVPEGKQTPNYIIISWGNHGNNERAGGTLTYFNRATYDNKGNATGGDLPKPGDVKVYYQGPWNDMKVYIYKDGTNPVVENAKWPGAPMTKENDMWVYTVPANLMTGKVVFKGSGGQYPGKGGLDIPAKSMIFKNNTWAPFN